jgi:hypothetical protein
MYGIQIESGSVLNSAISMYGAQVETVSVLNSANSVYGVQIETVSVLTSAMSIYGAQVVTVSVPKNAILMLGGTDRDSFSAKKCNFNVRGHRQRQFQWQVAKLQDMDHR